MINYQETIERLRGFIKAYEEELSDDPYGRSLLEDAITLLKHYRAAFQYIKSGGPGYDGGDYMQFASEILEGPK